MTGAPCREIGDHVPAIARGEHEDIRPAAAGQGILTRAAGPEELEYVPADAAVVAYANVRDVKASRIQVDEIWSFTYAKQNKQTHVAMRNAAGSYVQPSDTAFKAAAIKAAPNVSW